MNTSSKMSLCLQRKGVIAIYSAEVLQNVLEPRIGYAIVATCEL